MTRKERTKVMKVLLINGSPHKEGTTYTALNEVRKTLEAEGVECELIQVGHLTIPGCRGCGACFKLGKCVTDDIVNEVAKKFEVADGIIVGSPVYYAAPSGTIISFLNRLFYTTHFDKRDKVGAAVVCARRGGCTAAFDVLNKYFTISQMPVATSTYWNMVHGANAEDAPLDEEGMLCMRNLARNMSFLMKSIALGKEKDGLPQKENRVRTNFIRR
jgi:multimeric flavodoxin WrbA